MRTPATVLSIAALALVFFHPAFGAAEPPFFPAASDHDPAVPTFEQVLGYAVGEKMTDERQLGIYLQHLAQGNPRLLQRTYGRSASGRVLRYLVISHPDNMARLEAIREDSRRLADPRSLGDREAEAIVRNDPVIVWLAYGVHGNEHSSTEAALALAYHLSAARDDATVRMLRDAVVIIDPVQNPDGRERFLDYEADVAGPAPRTDPYAVEHDEPWPTGRYNHSLFDLNRDWFSMTQPETRGKVSAFLEWMPQVYVDLHEMESDATYYFAPPAEPINENIPASIRRWWGVFGAANAAAFDRAGLDYYTAERFDGYYPGYGDSWPTLHGAVGMTYEQASSRGLAIERKDGSILTLREAARHHFLSSLTTIATAAAHRQEMLVDARRYHRDAIAAGETGPVRAYLVPPAPAATALRLATLLARQGVEVYRTSEEFSARVRTFDGDDARVRTFPAGTIVVPLAQPAGRLANALMEPDPRLGEDFLAGESERRRLKEGSAIYDVTSWSLPILTGAEAFRTATAPRVAMARMSEPDLQPTGAIVPLAVPAGSSSAPYAYLLRYDSNAAAGALVSLLQTGLRIRAAGRPFRMGDEKFPAGTLVIRVHDDRDATARILRQEADTFGVTFYAVSTGLTDEGIDLGSGHVADLELPRVAVVYGEPTSATSLGGIIHLFDAVYGLPWSPVRADAFSRADLSGYGVIILPDESGGGPGYKEMLGGKGLARLRTWVDAGGTLVTLRQASVFAVSEAAGLSSMKRLMKPPSGEPRPAAAPAPGAAGQPDDEEPPDRVRGASLRVLLDPHSPLTFGYGSEGVVMVNSSIVLSAGGKGRSVATFAAADRLRQSGFAWDESLALLAGSSYLAVEPRGRGRVILFSDDPNFRGYWESLNRLFLNSVLFAPSFTGTD